MGEGMGSVGCYAWFNLGFGWWRLEGRKEGRKEGRGGFLTLLRCAACSDDVAMMRLWRRRQF